MEHRHHYEQHRMGRIAWLRAAVLGANDGIVSTSSLLLGVAAAGASSDTLLLTGLAGLVSGAMSMAAGEYVSVSSQADIERADIEIERRELAENPVQEQKELAQIYIQRGLDDALAEQVASQMMDHDALAAHSRDELGLSPYHRAKPLLAAVSSAASFALGGGVAAGFGDCAVSAPVVHRDAGGNFIILGPARWYCCLCGWRANSCCGLARYLLGSAGHAANRCGWQRRWHGAVAALLAVLFILSCASVAR